MSAELVVQSTVLTLPQIEQLLGVPSDPGGQNRGEPSRFAAGGERPRSTWVRNLVAPTAGDHMGTAGLSHALEQLDGRLAEAMRVATGRGCDVVLSLVQELDPGSTWDHGLHLSATAIAWLAAAGACVDVDQYVREDSPL